ncbi:phosphoglycerate kinase [bacterium]|nr:phosphoglycerate kinase [bacterium]
MLKFIKDYNFKAKRVFVRSDFNVPIKKAKVANDFRIRNSLETIKYLKQEGAKIILASHLGRPMAEANIEKRKSEFSLSPVAVRLSKFLKSKVKFVPDCIGKTAEAESRNLKPGEILLLENLRFYKGEEENNEKFAKSLAKLADVYVNEAFSVCHRKHASIVLLPKILPAFAGFRVKKEISVLTKIISDPARPLVVIIGGAKVSSKIKVVRRFFSFADRLLFGGKIANAILAKEGFYDGGPSFPKEEIGKEIDGLDLSSKKILLPIDALISSNDLKGSCNELSASKKGFFDIKKGEEIYDIGARTIRLFSNVVSRAKTIFWAGPLGFYENKNFEKGTKQVGLAVIKNKTALKVIGGGDTISAFEKFGYLNKIDFVSSGGGAMLAFLSGDRLPGIEALKDKE